MIFIANELNGKYMEKQQQRKDITDNTCDTDEVSELKIETILT